jgi:CRP/FNR family cyclic AMP-dependent transcriptional regulator
MVGHQLAQIREALERTRLISKWSQTAATDLCTQSEMHAYRDGERIITSGERVDAMWIVTEGSFFLTKTWANGRRFLYARLRPGQSTGLLPVFDGLPAAFDLTAHGNGTAIVVPGEVLRAMIRKHPEIAVDVLGLMCQRARMDLESIERHAMNSVRCRIAKSILAIADNQALSDRRVAFDTRISQEDLADIVCAARQSVNRELRRLMKEGIIKQGYRAIIVLDRERLSLVAVEDEDLSPSAHFRPGRASDYIFSSTD